MQSILGLPIQFFIWIALFFVAGYLTYNFNKNDSLGIKVGKYLGVLISTMPIIGIVQGLAFRSKAKGYSEACFYQATAGMVAYVLMKHVFQIIG